MESLEAGIMNRRRFAAVAGVLCQLVVLAAWVVAGPAGFGSDGIENTGAAPLGDRRAPSLAADAEFADAPKTTAMSNAAVGSADLAAANETGTTAERTAASEEPGSVIEAALTDSSQLPPPETPTVQVAIASTSGSVPNDAKEALS